MRVMTGIKPTGEVHLGNYAGAIKHAISYSNQTPENTHIFFIADLHSVSSYRTLQGEIYQNGLKLAATCIALGASNKTLIVRQSDVPLTTKNMWVLSSLTNLGMLYRAHAYKARIAEGMTQELLDTSLFMYPVLMASDIITMAADFIFVGSDQDQHIQIARDLVNRYNTTYRRSITLPVGWRSSIPVTSTNGLRIRFMNLTNSLSI